MGPQVTPARGTLPWTTGTSPLPPDGEFWLGLGRDLFSRLLYGARTSLIIGIAANATAVFIGTMFGATAGYVGGWVGIAIMRFTDLMMVFPAPSLAKRNGPQ